MATYSKAPVGFIREMITIMETSRKDDVPVNAGILDMKGLLLLENPGGRAPAKLRQAQRSSLDLLRDNQQIGNDKDGGRRPEMQSRG
jgi:hypothetical protein